MSKHKINRIRAYGCSFTVAEESSDYDTELMKYNVNFSSEEEIDRAKLKSNSNHEFYTKYSDLSYQDLRDYVFIPNSFANQLANNLGVDIVNRGESGTSNLSFIQKIEKDFLAGDIKKTDFVVIGMTTKERLPWVLPFKSPDWPDEPDLSFMSVSYGSKFLEHFDKKFMDTLKLFFHGKEWSLLATYFLYSVYAWNKILGGRLILVPAASDLTNPPDKHGCLFYDDTSDPESIDRLEFFNTLLKGIYLPGLSMNYEFDTFTPHVGYHPNKLHHKHFARKIENFIKDRIEVIK